MKGNPRVYLDIQIGTKVGGRVIFELFNDVAPRTVENFRGLCTGEYGTSKISGVPLCYRGCKFFKVIPGVAAQSGDFECNNGEGGDSIYGGHFPDESMLRRHCQAGVLSMANKGKNTNNSQFFITLKRAPHLDKNHVAFGQVIDGMEVLRAIEKCPIDSNHTPRVTIVIVDCGQVARLPGLRRDDPLLQMRDSVNTLMSTLQNEVEQKQTAAQLGLAKLQGKSENNTKLDIKPQIMLETENEDSLSKKLMETESLINEKTFIDDLDMKDEKQKFLAQLRLRLNESRKMNAAEVANEAKKNANPNLEENEVHKEMKNIIDGNLETDDNSNNDRSTIKKKNNNIGWDLNTPASMIITNDEIKKNKKLNIENSFGWNAMSTESHYRAHKKKIASLSFRAEDYAKQMLQLGDKFYEPTSALVSSKFKPTEEAKERLAEAVEKDKEKRKQFRRRRMYVDEENVQYINDFNRSFNKKLERSYGAQAVEIKQNLERGTAL